MIFAIVMFVVSTVLTLVMAPKMKKPPVQQGPKPAGLSDFDLPTAQEGRPIPIVWGTRYVEGSNVTWYANLRTKEIKE